MFAKSTFSALAALALASNVLAFNSHRHIHEGGAMVDRRHLNANEDRALRIHWVTEYVTVTVPAHKNQPAPTPVDVPVVETPPAAPVTTAQAQPEPEPPVAIELPPADPVKDEQASSSVEPPQVIVTTSAAPVKEAPTSVKKPEVESTPEAQPTQPPTNNNNVVSTASKRGLAYNQASLVNVFFTGSHTLSSSAWAYNWDSSSNGLKDPIEFVPMLWGDIPVHTSRWTKNCEASLASGSTHLLSFNEPDFPQQANMSPSQAASSHVKYMNPYAGRARIGSPAITNSNIAGQGLDWLAKFIPACDSAGCAIDFCVTHWYNNANAANDLFNHLEKVSNLCHGKPVWLTEFAVFGSDAEIANFMAVNLPKLDSLPYLERYSYFMASVGSLLSSNNGLSTIGSAYVSA